ncbi:hypothetical protein J4717_13850 [Phaeobacter sp. HS012]|uniref:ORC-CDC6 family AAA ATPase n=1 Tax=unclassified Phaeobacter TaxID=2621772 RepID=UPI001B38FFFB|nr:MULTISPECIES: hypothetical protein [unclassified Phaeobacter]MBQ4808554.1 hypothetical protein [Phaeobacter sp. HS012]MBQ4883227.1 hypothetical protein [Phaeobacter sp. HS011]
MRDPFIVHTPEQLTAQEIADYFVETYTDFPKLQDPVNMFIHGARGAGKSIMLRSLEPEVQRLLKKDVSLPFFAVHVPIKEVFFGNHEFRRLKGWRGTTVGEHLLAVHCMQYVLRAVSEVVEDFPGSFAEDFADFWEDCGGPSREIEKISKASSFLELAKFCDRESSSRVRQYYIRLTDEVEPEIYSGALTSFRDFLLPLVGSLQKVGPELLDKPICLMIDDADNLPEALQRVLNSWISTRAVSRVCFKVTTQLAYKTFRTTDNRIIESPHDFSEINISGLYTSSKGNFSKKIKAIVEKRLKLAGIDATPDEFFPFHKKQNDRRSEIAVDLLEGKRSNYVNLKKSGPKQDRDWSQRYATPALMRELASSKSSHTYSYAGLQSLVDLSSGVVRWFLEPAGRMYQETMKAGGQSDVSQKPMEIPTGVQDRVITHWSREFREHLNTGSVEAEAFDEGASLHTQGHDQESYRRLANLLDAMGAFCRTKLLDPSESEQRVFSFALSDEPSENLQNILHLGVRLGYLQKSDLAAKSTVGGRRPRYILSRRLGPHYRLDVSGYAAHLSVSCSDLEVAMHNPQAFTNRRKQVTHDNLQKSIDFGES